MPVPLRILEEANRSSPAEAGWKSSSGRRRLDTSWSHVRPMAHTIGQVCRSICSCRLTPHAKQRCWPTFQPARSVDLDVLNLSQKILTNLAAVDDFNRSIARCHQFFVAHDTEATVDRGGPVFHVQGIVFRLARS